LTLSPVLTPRSGEATIQSQSNVYSDIDLEDLDRGRIEDLPLCKNTCEISKISLELSNSAS